MLELMRDVSNFTAEEERCPTKTNTQRQSVHPYACIVFTLICSSPSRNPPQASNLCAQELLAKPGARFSGGDRIFCTGLRCPSKLDISLRYQIAKLGSDSPHGFNLLVHTVTSRLAIYASHEKRRSIAGEGRGAGAFVSRVLLWAMCIELEYSLNRDCCPRPPPSSVARLETEVDCA